MIVYCLWITTRKRNVFLLGADVIPSLTYFQSSAGWEAERLGRQNWLHIFLHLYLFVSKFIENYHRDNCNSFPFLFVAPFFKSKTWFPLFNYLIPLSVIDLWPVAHVHTQTHIRTRVCASQWMNPDPVLPFSHRDAFLAVPLPHTKHSLSGLSGSQSSWLLPPLFHSVPVPCMGTLSHRCFTVRPEPAPATPSYSRLLDSQPPNVDIFFSQLQ